MVIAPEHPLVATITTTDQQRKVATYVEKAKSKSDLERAELAKEKTGVWTGASAINPVNGKEIPVWVADYVLMTYGTGAIMAVPAHDVRDFEFAREFSLEIIQVIDDGGSAEKDAKGELTQAYTGAGKLINSGELSHKDSESAKTLSQSDSLPTSVEKLASISNYETGYFHANVIGRTLPCHLAQRKRLCSGRRLTEIRQAPVTCEVDGELLYAIILPETELPLELPAVESYTPSPDGQSPLSKASDWLKVFIDPKTGASSAEAREGWLPGIRETNTMPQWAGSCWYYLRYVDPKNTESPIDSEKEKYWDTRSLHRRRRARSASPALRTFLAPYSLRYRRSQ